jgi:hypothetical protein
VTLLLQRSSPLSLSPLNVPIKLDEKESLILNVRKEVIVPDEVKDPSSAETEVKGKSFARLSVRDVPAPRSNRQLLSDDLDDEKERKRTIRLELP